MKNVLSELWYNIKNGASVNFILIAQLVLFFWMSTVISSYFLDMPTTLYSNNLQENAVYYSLFYMPSDDEEYKEMGNVHRDPEYVSNLDKAYREIQEELGEHYLAVKNVDLKLDYGELSRVFTDGELLDFHTTSRYSGYYDPSQVSLEEIMPMYFMGNISRVFDGHTFRINQSVISHFNFQAKEGRMLDEDDFVFHKGQKEIPVLLGSAFSGKYRPGDILQGYLYTDTFDLKVIGILEKNTVIATDQMLETDGRPNTLDYSVVFPYFFINDIPETEAEKTFAMNNYEEALTGTVTADLATPRSEINSISKRLNNIFVRNGLFPISMIGSSYGVQLFKQESEQTMQIFLVASIIMGIMGISGICMSMITKINTNLQRYAIEIMNGQSILTLTAAVLAEVVLIVGVSMSITIGMFFHLIVKRLLFLAVIVVLSVASMLIVALVVIKKLMKIDIEEIIRSEE